ncbi:MAG TPA: ABC transporter ATP-binding protein [Fibrobacteria bacterium]|nr:ABC transporter ATP-binding protein [Fibrobacteria bacterium]
MSAVPAVSARGLVHSYPGGIKALDGVELEVAAGEILGLIGPNGAGKSTLLRILADACRAGAGDAALLGGVTGAERRRRVAYLAQDPALDPEMTVGETLGLFALLHGLPAAGARARMAEVASVFGIEACSDRLVARCSGGMRQRLHLALAFMGAADVFLLDEPTHGLDAAGREAFWGLVNARARAGAAVLASLHDLQEAAGRCGRIVLMAGGNLRADGAPEKLVAAHGAWTWRAALPPSGADAAELEKRLLRLPGVGEAIFRDGRVHLRFAGAGPSDPELLAVLEAAGVFPESYERRRPDLESVFHGLAIPWSATAGGAAAGARKPGGGKAGGRGEGRRKGGADA